MTPQDQLTRRRRVDPQSIVELLRGTPPPMPSGVVPPQVGPVPLGGGNPTLAPSMTAAPPAPALGISPDKQKILDMIRGVNARQPLSTPPPVAGAEIQPQQPEALNPTIGLAGGEETRPWKAGYGVGETDPLKREAARIRGMIENPRSEVNPDGSVRPVHPMSRKRAALLGLLKGINEAGQGPGGHTWASILGGGGAGVGIGIGSPKSIQEWQRRDDVLQAQGDLSNQMKLARGQADIDETTAQAEQRRAAPAIAAAEAVRKATYDQERLKIQRDAAAGRITAAEATNKLREAKMKQDVEEKEKDRENARTIAGMPARARPGSSTVDTTPKREAKLKEFEDTKAHAEILEGNADTNEQLAEAEPKTVLGEETPRAKELRKRADEFRKDAQNLRAKLPGLKADADAIPAQSAPATAAAASGTYAGKRFSRAKVAERAKSLGMTVAQAEKTITDGGGTLY